MKSKDGLMGGWLTDGWVGAWVCLWVGGRTGGWGTGDGWVKSCEFICRTCKLNCNSREDLLEHEK